MLTTIAVGIVLESGATISYGPLGRSLPSPLAERPMRLGGAGIYPQELLLPVVALALMLALEAFYRRTILGRAMRAVAFNRTVAGLMGINVSRIAVIAYAMAAAVAALRASSSRPSLRPPRPWGHSSGSRPSGWPSSPASRTPAAWSSWESATGSSRSSSRAIISSGARNAVGFTVMILLLLAVPAQGLFGRKEIAKV